MNRDMEQYGDDRLVKVVSDNLSSDTPVILEKLLSDLKSFVKDAAQSDDITCGIIKVTA